MQSYHILNLLFFIFSPVCLKHAPEVFTSDNKKYIDSANLVQTSWKKYFPLTVPWRLCLQTSSRKTASKVDT